MDQESPTTATTAALEPIAIVGIGCRFPGDADSPDAFWRLLCSGVDAITEIPADRWNLAAFHDPTGERPGTMQCRHGGFLRAIDQFDAGFFGISPREAAAMDPQQRLLLEVVWEALEDGGHAPERLAGSRTGVFIGCFALDYKLLLLSELQRELIGVHTTQGSFATMLANRISHWFDLRGPSVTLDTACSSSLVATHLACQSLWRGETRLAIAGGVNAIFKPEWTIATSRAGFLSPNGRCRAFSALGDGYVRSEGAGVVVLKPLAQALRDRDRIYALIRGTSSNQDGHTQGITVPNAEAQVALMREACAAAGVEPREVQYVEAHGTGTPVGDPIEARALGAVYGAGRPGTQPCVVGSVKTNVGHLEAAAGVAGLVKAALCLHHGQIPPNLHFEQPNPEIPFADLGLRVPTALEPYLCHGSDGGRRLAGVNSFGFGGANAHAVLESFGSEPETMPGDEPAGPRILPLSARSDEALRQSVRAHRDLLARSAAVSWSDICYSASLRRGHHGRRAAFVAGSSAEVVPLLERYLDDDETVARSGRAGDDRPRLVWVFSGMGPQWWGMGRELSASSPLFRTALRAACDAFESHAGWSLWDELTAPEADSRIDETRIAQPALFALQVALAALWRSWGVEPDAILGHSVGEAAAAHAAGALTLDDAARVIFHRSRLQHRTEGRGTMLAVGLAVEAAERLLNGHGNLGIAAVNSNRSVTLSGSRDALRGLAARLETDDIFHRFLNVEVPYHGPEMEPLAGELLAGLAPIRPRTAGVPLFSTVTGGPVDGSELTPGYWFANIRQRVEFARGIRGLLDQDSELFLEIGPHPVLKISIAEMAEDVARNVAVLSSLRRHEPEEEAMLSALAGLYVRGYPVDWSLQYPDGGRLAPLPAYPWQRQRHWLESEESRLSRMGARLRPGTTEADETAGHPLLGGRLATAEPGWELRLDRRELGYLWQHRIRENAVFPGAAYVEMALAAAQEMAPGEAFGLEGVTFREALFLADDGEAPTLQTIFDSGRAELRIHSRGERGQPWTQVASARLARTAGRDIPVPEFEETRRRCARPIDLREAYRTFADTGLAYGPAFQRVAELWLGQGEALARIGPGPDGLPSSGYRVHPALLDGCFQVFLAAVLLGEETRDAALYLPVRIEQVLFLREPGNEAWCHVRVVEAGLHRAGGDLQVLDGRGRPCLVLRGLICRRLERPQTQIGHRDLYEYVWEPGERTGPAPGRLAVSGRLAAPGTWLLLADEGGFAERLAARLGELGHVAIVAGERDDLEALFASAAHREPPCRGVVYACGLDTAEDPEDLEAAIGRPADTLVRLIQAWSRSEEREPWRLWLLTRGAQAVADDERPAVAGAPLWGLGRVIVNEHPGLGCRRLDLDPAADGGDLDFVLAELDADDPEDEVAVRRGARHVRRLRPAELAALGRSAHRPVGDGALPFRLECPVSGGGLLEGLRFRPAARRPPGPGEIEIAVRAAGLNFKDVAKAMGLLRDARFDGCYFAEEVIGFEASGVVTAVGEGTAGLRAGDEVVGFAPYSFGSHTVTDARLVALKPACLTHAEAATIPVVFVTAEYALLHLARLAAGERVLIHAAAGGVGLAAVQIAQRLGARVLATAGTPEKRDYLRALGVEHVMDSRSLDFAEEVLEATGGEGVDVVLNSLPGEALVKSVSVLARFGRFVEIGKQDIHADRHLGLLPFDRNLSFFAFDLDQLLGRRPAESGALLRALVDRFAEGLLRPIRHEVCPISEAVAAFRRLGQFKTLGKTVFALDGAALPNLGDAGPVLDPEATYLVTGGLAGLGLAVARWLSRNGARHLVLAGRRGAATPGAREALAALRAEGTEVVAAQADVAREEEVRRLLATIAESMPVLHGVVHAANVYDDAVLEQMSPERLRAVLGPKALGAWHLHRLTLDLPLDFFVTFSSIVSLTGNPGQGNYCAANAFLDALAHLRRALGRPALTIDWGALGGAGYVAQSSKVRQHLADIGMEAMPLDEAFDHLGALMATGAVNPVVARVDWARWARSHEAGRTPRFAHLVPAAAAGATTVGSAFLDQLESADDRRRTLATGVRTMVARVLGRSSAAEIEAGVKLSDMGMDSMLALELRNLLERQLGRSFPSTLVFKYPSLELLLDYLEKEVLAGPAHDRVPERVPDEAPTEWVAGEI